MPHFNPGINVDDDGVNQGRYDTIDFTTGITATPGTGKIDVSAAGGGGSMTVKDEGVTLDSAVTSMDFVGGGVTATNVGHAVTVTISAASALTLKDEGSTLDTAVTSIDVVGAGGKATNSGHAVTLTIPGAVADTLANRPAAGSANQGEMFFATDVKLGYISSGAAWTTLSWEISAIAALDTDGTLAANSDSKIASQKATKTYADLKTAKASNLSDVASAPLSRYNLHDQVLAAAKLVSTTNLSLTGAATVDGVAVSTGDIVLAVGQTSASQNGPWVANTGGAWTRSNDYPAAGTVVSRIIAVTGGTFFAGTTWESLSSTAVTIDTTATTWAIIGPRDGWFTDTDTWTFVSATSFKITGKDVTARFPKGTRISYNDGAVDYGVVASAVFGSDTTVTLITNSDYSIANTTLTAPRFSYAARPQAFPFLFNWTPTLTGYSVAPTNTVYQWFAIGNQITLEIREASTGTQNAAAQTYSLPVAAATITNGVWSCYANGSITDGVIVTLGGLQIVSAATTGSRVKALASLANGSITPTAVMGGSGAGAINVAIVTYPF